MRKKQARNSILKSIFISSLLILTSCIGSEGGGRKGRPLIKKIGSTGGSTLCTATFDVVNGSCISACDTESTHEGTAQEVTDLIAEINSSNEIDADTKVFLLENIDSAFKVCVSGASILRPSDAITVKNDYCACMAGLADVINGCETKCKTLNTDTTSLFFGEVEISAEIELNAELGSLFGWCNNEITGSANTAPGCFFEVNDGTSSSLLPIEIGTNSNNFTVDITALKYDTPYLATIVESQASNARSKTFQFYRKKFDTDPDTLVGPLKIMPVSQYSCISRAGSTDNGDFFDSAARQHFYFPINNNPPTQAPGQTFLICHDTNLFGANDSPLFPRLELIPQHYSIWDNTDPRFADLDGDSEPDINKILEEKLLDEFNQNRDLKVFNVFSWQNAPASGLQPMGFYMIPWIDNVSGRAFCPTQENYNGSDPIFKVMKETVGIDTEGLYVAEREPLAFTDADGVVQAAPQDVLFIRENILKKIWFYFENNQHLVPDEITSGSKTVLFYWPADVNDPYVRKSTQKIYTVKSPDSLGQSGNFGDSFNGIPTNVRPPDKRLGCIPSLD